MRQEIGETTRHGYRPVELATPRGPLELRWYDASRATCAVAYVGGVGGGWDTPARGLYPRLCAELTEDGVSGLRVRFRESRQLAECVYDLLAGIAFLEEQHIPRIGVVGHSLGGAVAIQAAVGARAEVVVTLATQSNGTQVVADLPADCALLLIHGAEDLVLSPSASRDVYELAHEPKDLRIMPFAGHALKESAEEVHAETVAWLREWLGVAALR